MYSTYGTNYGYDYNYGQAAGAAAGVAAGIMIFYVIMYIVAIAAAVVQLIGMWKAFTKMGKKGYEALIPGHDTVVLLEKANMPLWYFFLMLIPVCNIIFGIKVCMELARKFGKTQGFGVLLFFFGFVCWPILGFGNAVWKD
jgi:hypothetical protein